MALKISRELLSTASFGRLFHTLIGLGKKGKLTNILCSLILNKSTMQVILASVSTDSSSMGLEIQYIVIVNIDVNKPVIHLVQ